MKLIKKGSRFYGVIEEADGFHWSQTGDHLCFGDDGWGLALQSPVYCAGNAEAGLDYLRANVGNSVPGHKMPGGDWKFTEVNFPIVARRWKITGFYFDRYDGRNPLSTGGGSPIVGSDVFVSYKDTNGNWSDWERIPGQNPKEITQRREKEADGFWY